MPTDPAAHPWPDRVLHELIAEVADELGITLTATSQDWILRLSRGAKHRFIVGYNFELNSATARMIAGDKAAATRLLEDAGLPCIEHELFLQPRLAEYVGEDGNWSRMIHRFNACDHSVVCKANEGTGGASIFLANSPRELEYAVTELFRTQRAICLSPHYDLDHEYRCVMLDGRPMLAYEKCRPTVTGDGESTLLQLLADQVASKVSVGTLGRLLRDADRGFAAALASVPPDGMHVVAGWKHNLAAGATAQLVTDRKDVEQLATQAADAINLTFGAVDVVQTAGQLRVLEINAGVMMEQFATADDQRRAIAKDVYRQAVIRMMDI